MSKWKPDFNPTSNDTVTSNSNIVSDEGSKDNQYEVIKLSEWQTEWPKDQDIVWDNRWQQWSRSVGYQEEVDEETTTEPDDGKTEMAKVFDDAWATDLHLAEVFYDGTIADKIVPLGTEWDFETVPDHRIRIMAADRIAKMKGHYTNRAIEKKKRRTNKIFFLVQDWVR